MYLYRLTSFYWHYTYVLCPIPLHLSVPPTSEWPQASCRLADVGSRRAAKWLHSLLFLGFCIKSPFISSPDSSSVYWLTTKVYLVWRISSSCDEYDSLFTSLIGHFVKPHSPIHIIILVGTYVYTCPYVMLNGTALLNLASSIVIVQYVHKHNYNMSSLTDWNMLTELNM